MVDVEHPVTWRCGTCQGLSQTVILFQDERRYWRGVLACESCQAPQEVIVLAAETLFDTKGEKPAS